MTMMLPSNAAAAAGDVAVSNAVNGAGEVNGTDQLNGTGQTTCYTPVTDPDSIALLAAMHEANRFVTHV